MYRLYKYGNTIYTTDGKKYVNDGNVASCLISTLMSSNVLKVAPLEDSQKNVKYVLENILTYVREDDIFVDGCANYAHRPYVNDDLFEHKVNNFTDFLNKINIPKDESRVSYCNYVHMFDEDLTIGVIRGDIANNPNPYILYKVESQAIYDTWKQIFKLDSDSVNEDLPKSRCIILTDENSYSFLCRKELLEVILEAARLKSENEELFKQFKKKKPNGKVRIIYAPNEDFKKKLQECNFLLQQLLDHRNADYQVAYKKGKSILDAAKPHALYKHSVEIDLSNFFPSCNRIFVKKQLEFLFNSFNSEKILNMFLDAILIDDGLFIGNPISGTLANAVISAPVKYIKNICDQRKIEFTVYADDMTFSSDRFIPYEMIIGIFDQTLFKSF